MSHEEQSKAQWLHLSQEAEKPIFPPARKALQAGPSPSPNNLMCAPPMSAGPFFFFDPCVSPQ